MTRRDESIYQFMKGDTVKRAEELCASMSSTLDLERRGQVNRYQGAVADINEGGHSFIKVSVAESAADSDQLTLISDAPLPASSNALLVYRSAPGHDFKYVGRHPQTHPGQRPEDSDQPKHITTYTILREVRDRR